VELHRSDGHADGVVGGEEKQLGRCVGTGDEHWVGLALKAGEDVGAKVRCWADKVLGAQQQVGQDDAEEDGHDPGADEALDCLLGGQLDQLGAAESDAADVGEDVVSDDQRGRQEEPDQALEHVIHDEVRLHDDEEKSHVRPGELRELELEVPGLKGANEEDKAWRVSRVRLLQTGNIPKT